jgi:hypothetical protein
MTMTQPAAGWYRDPSRRHDHRWWDGAAWTPHVMTLGLRSVDYGGDASSVAVDDAPTGAADETELASDAVVAPASWRWPAVVWVTVVLGAALLALGALLPWAEASSGSASFSSSGIDGNGAAALGAALAIALLCTVRRRPMAVAGLMIGIAAVAGAVAVHDAIDISHKADRLMQRVPATSAGVGVGIWVTLAGAAVAIVGGVMALVSAARASGRD